MTIFRRSLLSLRTSFSEEMGIHPRNSLELIHKPLFQVPSFSFDSLYPDRIEMTAVQSKDPWFARISTVGCPLLKVALRFHMWPPSLMMAMKYFDESINLSKDLEMDIWREANMIESYGTSRYGLAFAAARRGFRARVCSNIGGYGFLNNLRPPIEGRNRRMPDSWAASVFEDASIKKFRLSVSQCTLLFCS